MKASSINDAVKRIIELLVEGQYDEIALVTRGERLSTGEIESAVVDYGKQLVAPPNEAYRKLLDVVQVAGTSVPTWSICMPLWTREEGRSDLTMELTIAEKLGEYNIELDGIHVL